MAIDDIPMPSPRQELEWAERDFLMASQARMRAVRFLEMADAELRASWNVLEAARDKLIESREKE